MIVIRMPGGIVFHAYDSTIEKFTEEFSEALKKQIPLIIPDENGSKHVLNPVQILYFEESM